MSQLDNRIHREFIEAATVKNGSLTFETALLEKHVQKNVGQFAQSPSWETARAGICA